jgi:hypothetical protein
VVVFPGGAGCWVLGAAGSCWELLGAVLHTICIEHSTGGGRDKGAREGEKEVEFGRASARSPLKKRGGGAQAATSLERDRDRARHQARHDRRNNL